MLTIKIYQTSQSACCDCLAALHVDKQYQTEYNKGQIQ